MTPTPNSSPKVGQSSSESERSAALEAQQQFNDLANNLSLQGQSDVENKIALLAMLELEAGRHLLKTVSDRPIATIFGSARTPLDSPLARLASALSAELVSCGWRIMTGAGPGIMEAASQGAGREFAIGINIALPFEHASNEYVEDARLLSTEYFFTRKVIMTRSSHAFVAFPGGVGTLDELFEVLTLLQTCKTTPAPVVLMDSPDGTFWSSWQQFLKDNVLAEGYLSEGDDVMYTLCTDVATASEVIRGFYRNYITSSTNNGTTEMWFRRLPTTQEREALSLLVAGAAIDNHAGVLRFPFDGRKFAVVRRVIDLVNSWTGDVVVGTA